MKPVELLEILHTAERLKDVTRHSYTSGGRHESVAEHSWRITLMAFLLRDEFPELDMDKVLRMCLIHDLGECFTGDIPAFDKTADAAGRVGCAAAAAGARRDGGALRGDGSARDAGGAGL